MGDPVIGKRIRAARLSLGLSQAEFAREIGLKHPQSVSNYERGVDDPDRKRMLAIASVTGLPVSHFLDPTQSESHELRDVADRLARLEAQVLELAQLVRESLAQDAESRPARAR